MDVIRTVESIAAEITKTEESLAERDPHGESVNESTVGTRKHVESLKLELQRATRREALPEDIRKWCAAAGLEIQVIEPGPPDFTEYIFYLQSGGESPMPGRFNTQGYRGADAFVAMVQKLREHIETITMEGY